MISTHEIEKIDFDVNCFVPAAYNKTYYATVMQDEAALLAWQTGPLDDYIRNYLDEHKIKRFSSVFDAGCGPSVHRLFTFVKYTKKLKLADYMLRNLEEVKKWEQKSPRAHDWSLFVAATIEKEGNMPTKRRIAAREDQVRRSIESYTVLDLKKPVKMIYREASPLVTNFFVADSATRSKKVFAVMTKNAFRLVGEDGLFIAAYLGDCTKYRVGRRWINSASITESDIRLALEKAGAKKVTVWRFETPQMAHDGFNHIFAAVAEK